MNKIKQFLLFSLFANAVLLSLFCYKLYNNWFEIGVLKTPFRASIFNEIPVRDGKIYFVGDSHTEAFELNELLENPDVRNRGIWGDNSKGLLARIGEVAKRHPKKVFVMIGVNDVCAGTNTQKIANDVEAAVKQIKNASPNTQIFIESVLPTNWTILHSKDRAVDRIKYLNELYRLMCKKHDLIYVDLFPGFLEGNELKQEYSFDGIHLNGKGYVYLANCLKPYVNH